MGAKQTKTITNDSSVKNTPASVGRPTANLLCPERSCTSAFSPDVYGKAALRQHIAYNHTPVRRPTGVRTPKRRLQVCLTTHFFLYFQKLSCKKQLSKDKQNSMDNTYVMQGTSLNDRPLFGLTLIIA